jgi:type II secretory pathway pseudopilin PulG
MQQAQATRHGETGFAMAALLVAIAVMAVLMSVALPVWKQAAQREKEAELVWRGEQYDRAIQLYRKKNGAPGAPNLDILVEQKFLRKKYKDPITGGDFELKAPGMMGNLTQGPGGPRQGPGSPSQGPGNEQLQQPQQQSSLQPQRAQGQLIGGVRSKSKAKSIRLLNGRDRYDQWEFAYKPYGTKTVPTPGGGRQPGLTPGTTRPGTTPSTRPGSSPSPFSNEQ